MTQVSGENFGHLIAYLIPGFLVLAGLSPHLPVVQSWLAVNPSQAPTLGGFLFATIAAAFSGLTASTIRWLALDRIHSWSGLTLPSLDFSRLQDNIDAFHATVEYHYRYYQFYGNSVVALAVLGVGHWHTLLRVPGHLRWLWVLAFLSIMVLFYFASRDALKKYFERLEALHLQATLREESSNDKRRTSPKEPSDAA